MSVGNLSVLIDGRVHPKTWGGVAHSAMGLIHALGQLDDSPERYQIVVESDEQWEWLKQYVGPNQRLVMKAPNTDQYGQPRKFEGVEGFLKRVVRKAFRAADQLQDWVGERPRPWPVLEVSDGFFESLGCQVIHFTSQRFALCAMPSIYNPHDLQHLHYPQFFTAHELARREVVYPAGCHYAQTVAVGTEWIKQDVMRQYGTAADKIQVIPWAPPTHSYPLPAQAQLEAIRRKYALNHDFALYPAVVWPHKNHARLFEALAWLRQQSGLSVHLVCTGSSDRRLFWGIDYLKALQEKIAELGLGEQVKFLGFVPEEDMRGVYRLAQFLILPSLFEADSCPIHEAWSEGVPVASSNHPALCDQVGDAGLLFDATDKAAIADAVERMATDSVLRSHLIERGHKRVRDFDWIRTAKAYRAVYRRAAGITLNEEDRWLLQWNWMREPDKSSGVTAGT